MRVLSLVIIILIATSFTKERVKVRVGAKHFTEGYILSEMISQILEARGYLVERKYNLGGTLVCFEALKNNEIDIYPEYTGTITREILRSDDLDGLDKLGLSVSAPYGFNNTYAIAIKRVGIGNISDLSNHPELKAGISYEFLKRQDGWEALAKTYGLPQQPVGLEHGLAYQALTEGKIDLTDCYSTDGEIAANDLIILKDDKAFFPKYEAVSLYRSDLDKEAIEALNKLTNTITEKDMSAMNASAIFDKKDFSVIANEFLRSNNLVTGQPETRNAKLFEKVLQHLYLTFTALVIAILIAVPLGVWLYFRSQFSNTVLYIAGLLQTIPSIALLALMIPLLGIGALPAIVALFLYAILPILRNTVNGLRTVDPLLKEVAAGLGMSRVQSLRYVEWPLALPTILTGIRVAAVINVGTATLAAFIGAGGLGEYIVTGLALNNTGMILTGAIPAAILALVIELVFEAIERRTTPLHLRRNRR